MVKRDSITAKAKSAWLGCCFANPPDSAAVTGQAAASINAVKTIRIGNRTASACSAKRSPALVPPSSATLRLNIGMKAAENAPPANSARNRLGRRKETKHASAARTEERRGGKGGVRQCRNRGAAG